MDKRRTATVSGAEACRGSSLAYVSRRAEDGARRWAPSWPFVRSVQAQAVVAFRTPDTSLPRHPGVPVTYRGAHANCPVGVQGAVRIHLTLTSHAGPKIKSYNVIADLKGSEHPEQIVVVSGHLDSWDLGTGALDDGAGVATAMETAEILQSLHLRPKRTLRVIAWMDEERDGRGHDAYAAEHRNEFGHYAAALESDSGAGHPLGFDVSMSAAALNQLRPVAEVLQPIGANLLQMVANSPEADIAPISQQGVPALGLMQDTRPIFAITIRPRIRWIKSTHRN